MSVSTIECLGSEYPMGVLQGRLFKDSVAEVWQVVQNSHMLDLVRPRLMPKQLHLIHCQKKADTFLKPYLAKFAPIMNERIHGIVQGSAIAEEALYFLHSLEMELMTKPDTFATSSGLIMALSPEKALQEELLLAGNIDNSLPLSDHLLIRKSRPREGFQSVELTYTFQAGCIAGVNEKGLALFSIPAYATDSISLKTVPYSLQLQEALKTCDTVEAAAQLLASQNRDGGTVVVIADSKNNMLLFEGTRTSVSTRPLTGDFSVFGSKYSSPELEKSQIQADAVWTSKAWSPFAGQKVHESALKRVDTARGMISKLNGIDEEQLWRIMGDHGSSSTGDDNSICRHGNALTTIAALIISPKDRSIQLRQGNPCTGVTQSFKL